MFGGTGRRISRTTVRAARVLMLALLMTACGATIANAASVTVTAKEYVPSGPDTALSSYTYIVNVDNAKDPMDPNPSNRPGFGGTESNSPVVAVGDETTGAFDLPIGKYLVSVRSPGHKMWGKHIVVPDDSAVSVSLRPTPIPRGKIKVLVFNDNHWTNGALDAGEVGIKGIHIALYDQGHAQITVDADGKPLCGGQCLTDSDGFVSINNLGPGLYHVMPIPPKGSGWHQDTTIDGGFFIPIGVQEDADGTGAPQLGAAAEAANLPPGKVTANQIGMAHATSFSSPGTGVISGTAKSDVSWPPQEAVTLEDPVDRPYVALSDMSTDGQVYMGRGNKDGTFTIPNVPAGSYFISIWDEQLMYVTRFETVDVAAGQHVDLNQADANGDGLPDGGIGVARWQGWLEGNVYYDTNGNGVQDPGEKPVPNTDVDQRWRDGSIMGAQQTDKNGHYQWTQAEGGPLGKWFIGEVGFSRFATTGASMLPDPAFHAPHAPDFPPANLAIPTDLGGGLLTNQQVAAGHHAVVNWGKKVYAEGETGQIVGIVYHATTRNETESYRALHEDYEPGVPGVVVRLEGLGRDGKPNTADDPTLNEYTTDHWANPTNCEMRDVFGALVPAGTLNPAITADCLEAPSLSAQTVDGKFDGGYAFANYCPPNPDGSSSFPCENPVPLTAGKYITHVLMPNDGHGHDLYQVEKEEDVNVDQGPDFTPAIPAPPCVGDPHIVPSNDFTSGRGGTAGKTFNLCDKHLVSLKNKQNANSDFNVFTSTGVQIPGRIVGLVSNDVYVDANPQDFWYQNKRGEPHVPLGIYDRDPEQGGRLITTIQSDETGLYDVLLPSTETQNCPIPQGICPGEYWFVINDPGTKQHPNKNYRQDLLSDGAALEVWPGQTTQADTPVTPISGDGCALPGTQPQLMQASKAYVAQSDTGNARRITLEGENFGAPGTVSLEGGGQNSVNAGIVSWDANTIVLSVPSASGNFYGPKQLLIHADTGDASETGLTVHVQRTTNNSYNPTVVNVGSPASNAHALQNAINGASAGSVLLLGNGLYQENIILNKPLTLQGRGPGGTNGNGSLPGSGVDGAFFAQNAPAWRTTLNTTSWSGPQTIAEGAGITVVAPDTGGRAFPTSTNTLNKPRIDGLTVRTGQGEGAGGIQVNAYARNLQITNDVIEGNGGQYAGGIALGSEHGNGTTAQSSNHNDNTVIAYDHIAGNGAAARAGGVGIFYGADNYQVRNSTICSNYSFEYGGGLTQYGRSTGGSITDNKIYYNAAFDSGGAITLSEQLKPGVQPTPQNPNPPEPLGTGTGSVTVDRNLIEGNFSGDDGGAIYLRSAYGDRINMRENMMVDNGAANAGGAVMLADSSNVAFVNNTVAQNATTGTFEGHHGDHHAAGLASEANNPLWQQQQNNNAPRFSSPVALFNDIFNQNIAYTYDQPTNTLTSQGPQDFEVLGTAGTLRPQRSVLSTAYGPTNPNPNNLVGLDPLFLTSNAPTFNVVTSAADPSFVSVSLTTGALPQGLLGDYHLSTESDAIDRGVLFNSNFVFAPNRDIDNDFRPQLRTPGRLATPFDLGADEVPQ